MICCYRIKIEKLHRLYCGPKFHRLFQAGFPEDRADRYERSMCGYDRNRRKRCI